MLRIEQWRAGILSFEAKPSGLHPFLEIRIEGTFEAPSGRRIIREAYWDGGTSYRISFAPTEPGEWSYRLSAPPETGLDGVRGKLACVPAQEGPAVYRHGFLRVSRDGRFLTYADGTPFFWLGDTHWSFVTGERWDESNHPEMASMFRGMVDRRVEQGFTVYQCNLMGTGAEGFPSYWEDGEEGRLPNIAFYQSAVDPRMDYLAQSGLVIALGFAWTGVVLRKKEMLLQFARYIAARYGAYPIVWTLGGEIAGYSSRLRESLLSAWREVALQVERLDSYGHLQTVHYTTERPYADYYYEESWFDFALNQAGHGDHIIAPHFIRDHLRRHPGKPFVEGESLYEFCATLEPNGPRRCTADMLRQIAYMTIQLGGCGYTYGAQGIWDAVYEKPETPDRSGFNTYGVPWWEAIDGPGAWQMGAMRRFYEETHFERLRPAPDAARPYGELMNDALPELCLPLVSMDERAQTVVVYFTLSRLMDDRYVISGLTGERYRAEWFDPRTGAYEEIGVIFPEHGEWLAPLRPVCADMLLRLISDSAPTFCAGTRTACSRSVRGSGGKSS